MRIYAVNCDPGRGERLKAAAAPLNLDLVLVQSPLKDDPEVVRRGATCFARETSYATGFAATLGHIRCMQALVDSGEPLGIIIEDDVRFHKAFNEVVDALIPYMMEGNTDILSLGYINIPHGEHYHTNGHILIRNVGLSNPWGAQCYMITREWAAKFCKIFEVDDVSIPYQSNFITDWVMFDPILGCRRDTLMWPIAVEGPDEQSIAAFNHGKPDLFQTVSREHFYL
jgi:GR25 family glycosyltransferase involved in LPS biosynthesis